MATLTSQYDDTADSLTVGFGQQYYGYSKVALQMGNNNLSLLVGALLGACIFILAVFIKASYTDIRYIPFK
jgi:hypothetical protein